MSQRLVVSRMAEQIDDRGDIQGSGHPMPPMETAVEQHKEPNYVLVFGVLVVLTIVEVLITYTPLPRAPLLLPISFLKAALVVLYYMHLRNDKRVFGAIFVMGILMGLILIIALTVIFSASNIEQPHI